MCCSMKCTALLNKIFLPKMLNLNSIKPVDLTAGFQGLEEPVKRHLKGCNQINQELEAFCKPTCFIEDKT